MKNLPAWLETLYNVNPTLAERAYQHLKNQPNNIKFIKNDLQRQIENIDFVRTPGDSEYLKGYSDALDFCRKQFENSVSFVEQIEKFSSYE